MKALFNKIRILTVALFIVLLLLALVSCDLFSSDALPPDGECRHKAVVDEAVEPTCARDGLTEGSHCSLCGEILVEQSIIYALEHRYEGGKCEVCGEYQPTPDEYFNFVELEDGTYSVSAAYKDNMPEQLVIPSRYERKPVSEVAYGGFESCNKVKSVIITSGIKTIGSGAFGHCEELTEVFLPDGLTAVGQTAFLGCDKLKSVRLPDTLSEVGSDAFPYNDIFEYTVYENARYLGNENNPYLYFKGVVDKNISSVSIHGETKIIGYNAFYNCKNLTGITLSDNIVSIGDEAFSDCQSLSSVTVPDSVESIGYSVFQNCISFTEFTLPSSIAVINDGMFSGCKNLTSVTLPETVTGIGYRAFSDCEKLMGVTIPSSVEWIGSGAFSNCKSIKSIVIPDSVKSIGGEIFSGCDVLTSITVGKGVTKISHLAFSGCSALREFYYNATDCADIDNVTVLFNNSGDRELGFKLIVGANVKRIPDRMFANNVAFPSTPALTAIEFEDGSLCESIGTYAFKGCVRLESLTLPDSMKSIGMSAFVACVGIKEIKFGKNLSTIGYGAFESCEGLTQLIYPKV